MQTNGKLFRDGGCIAEVGVNNTLIPARPLQYMQHTERIGGDERQPHAGLGLDLGILRAGSGSGRAKKSPVFFLAARARPDPVAGP